jgi:hypothetical protein
MTRYPIAQIALNGNLKSQETRASLPFSCRIDYFTRGVLPAASTASAILHGRPSRLLRFAHNDPSAYGHCEERSDEAISICGSMDEKGSSDFDQYRTSTRVEARQTLPLAACGIEIAGV